MRALAFKLSVLRSHELPFLDAVWIRLSGDAIHSLTFSGPFLSEPTKAWLLTRRGFTLAEGFAATLTAAVMNLGVGAVMGTAGLVYLLRDAALPASAAGAAVGEASADRPAASPGLLDEPQGSPGLAARRAYAPSGPGGSTIFDTRPAATSSCAVTMGL